MKSHKFDVEDAVEFGVNKAIILQHLKFHMENNQDIDEFNIQGHVWCYARLSALGKMYPYFTKSSISRWLRELEEDGVVESMKPKKKVGVHTKYYRIIGISQNRKRNSQNESSKKSQNGNSSIDNCNTISNKENTKENNPYPFEDFWDDYDKKVDKQKAKKKFKKLGKKDRLAIKEFIPYYKIHQPDAQFRKHPTTFLNNRSWEDDWVVQEAKKKMNGTSSKNKNFETAKKAVDAFDKLNFED